MRVGFDLDGVLYDFGASVRRYMESIGLKYGWKDNGAEPHTWNFFEYWGMSPKDFVQLCHDGADAGFIFCGDIRPNAAAAVNIVKKQGHEVVIITDRSFGTTPQVSETHTKLWLKQHGIPYDELHFSPDKTIVPTDIFVEDKLENYDAITAAGTECWLINRPWNSEGDPDDRNRINDIMDYVAKVEDMSRRRFEAGFADFRDWTERQMELARNPS
jgi:FMN phosphatase YigB (HAD superfamily)